MASLAEIKALLQHAEEEFGDMANIFEEMKTEGGHLTTFGDEFVALCRKHKVKQSVVARAIGVSPTAISLRYNKKK